MQETRVRKLFEDAGHAWLRVSKAELVELGIQNKISSYSYQKDSFAFLEEDCDLGVYVGALSSRGIVLNIERVYQRESHVRSFGCYSF